MEAHLLREIKENYKNCGEIILYFDTFMTYNMFAI